MEKIEIEKENEKDIITSTSELRVSQIINLTGLKKVVGARVKKSHLDAPPICLSLSCDMSQATLLKENENKKNAGKIHITFTDIIIRAAAQAIKLNKLLNASINEDENTIVLYEDITIGIATNTNKSLLVPVIQNTEKLELEEIALSRDKLLNRVRNGKYTIEDISDGTFTITNLGMFGIESFEPIISLGQSAILSIGLIKNTPVIDEFGKIYIRSIMVVSVTCDHRVVDGADTAKFLNDFKRIIEEK